MTRKEVQKRIKAYFDSRYGPVLDRNKAPVTDENGNTMYEITNPPTLSGLALWLGLDEREKLTSFTKNKAIIHDVKCAVLKIEEYAEERLFFKDANTAGIKLYLAVNFKRWSGEELNADDDELPQEYNKWAE